MSTKPSIEPYQAIPSAYLHSEKDLGFPIDAQEAALAGAMERAPGKFTLVDRLPSGHMSVLSMPNEVAGFLVKAAESV
jgi:hypothetical protein